MSAPPTSPTSFKDAVIDGVAYKLVPVNQFHRLLAGGEGGVDALDFARRSIAHRLRESREAAGMSPEELGRAAQVSVDTIRAIEAGEVRLPDVATMDALYDALGVD